MWDTSMRVKLSSVVMVSSLNLLALIHSEVSPKEVIFKNVRKFVVTGGTTQVKRHYKGQNDQREMNKFGGNKLSF